MSQEKIQGGAFGGVDDLYREVILDHFKSPKNKGRLDKANAQADGMNPLCGDQVHITAVVDGNKVKDIRFEGHGCAISQSATSMMTQLVKGKTIHDAQDLSATFKKMFGVEESKNGNATRFEVDDLGDSIALEGVKKYPVRIKCALLSWNTLMESLKNYAEKERKNG